MNLIRRLLPFPHPGRMYNRPQTTIHLRPPPAIHMPEIIHVFSHLNERDLHSAGVVNRFWHLLSLDFLHVQLHWRDTVSSVPCGHWWKSIH